MLMKVDSQKSEDKTADQNRSKGNCEIVVKIHAYRVGFNQCCGKRRNQETQSHFPTFFDISKQGEIVHVSATKACIRTRSPHSEISSQGSRQKKLTQLTLGNWQLPLQCYQQRICPCCTVISEFQIAFRQCQLNLKQIKF